MPYPPVIQFETRTIEADARTRLARELRRAAPAPTSIGRRPLVTRLLFH
jgi:hypothetical protein